MELAELAVLMLSLLQAMVYGWDHPCRHENCDKQHIPNDLQILRLNFRRDASYDYDVHGEKLQLFCLQQAFWKHLPSTMKQVGKFHHHWFGDAYVWIICSSL